MMITDIIKLMIALLAIIVVTICLVTVNLNKRIRQRQYVLAIFAGIFSFAISIIMLTKKDGVLLIYQAVDNGDIPDILLLNITVVAVYFIIKLLYVLIMKTVFKSPKFKNNNTEGNFYSFDADYSQWFLNEKWLNVREIFKYCTIVETVIFGLFFGITWCTEGKNVAWLFLFPVVTLICTAEIYNYLNGYTKQEHEKLVYGEDVRISKISNFYRIRDIYEKMFSHVILSANTAADYMFRPGMVDTLKRISDSGEAADKLTAQFFSQYENKDEYDVDAVEATRQMMKGNNVIFFNPFYRDLGKYLILPMYNTLLSDKKILVVLGRNSTEADVKLWLNETVYEYNHIKSLWTAEELTDKTPDCEIGIINYSKLYEPDVTEANESFFSNTGFVILLEPSAIISTGQIGLSLITEQLGEGVSPVFCIIDRMTDGIVDTMSHLLHTEFTHVVAAPVPRCIYSGLSWDADGDYLRQEIFDKETRFLGNGLELAATAVKNQIPKVSWYGEKKVPIKDIKWIVGQHYNIISKYMNIPTQQQSIYEKIDFISNLWKVSDRKEEFLIVEDEFCNMFSAMHTYLARGKEQAFVNVLSENYLFRDYMRCNSQLFISNPDAIPSLVPDYVKSERNLLIKLILNMVSGAVTESYIKRELSLLDVNYETVSEALNQLLEKYTDADETIFNIKTVDYVQDGNEFDTENTFEISKAAFDEQFAESLKTAYYIIEDEECSANKIDARMYGHIVQSILPGQFLTYNGKYYRVKSISSDGGVILRRASDLYDGRKYYKQVRKYFLEGDDNESTINTYNIMDIEIAEIYRNITVQTTGYLEMQSNNNLRSARLIDFTNNPDLNEKYTRKYKNKCVLRVKLPDTDDKIRFTVSLLLSEAFRTIFPDSYQFIAVVTARPQDIKGILNCAVYEIEGDYNEEYIYVIEDSEIDMGLLGSIEKNWMRFMEIIADYLNWHFEKMKEPYHKDPVVGKVELPEDRKRQNLRRRMLKRIKQLFGTRKEEKVIVPEAKEAEKIKSNEVVPEVESSVEENSESLYEPIDDEPSVYTFNDLDSTDNDENMQEVMAEKTDESIEEPKVSKYEEDEFMPEPEENPDIVDIDGTDIFDNEGAPEDEIYLEESFKELGIDDIKKTRYQKECFLKFGFEEIDSRLHIEELKQYLSVHGWSNNSLKEARNREVAIKTNLDFDAVNHCDFCGKPLSGVSYEKLSDGRIRCNDCAASAIDHSEEFTKLFNRVLETMESFFNIEFKVAVSAKMTDAKTIAKGYGSVFVPSTEFAERVIGFAQRKKGNFSVLIENGSPRLATISTIVHEMTHIWQYRNWDEKRIKKLYDKNRNRDLIYEGMAIWASIQYLYMIGETSYAYQQELVAERREDIYGDGFRLFRDKYPLLKDSSLLEFSPFSVFPPI